jgi:hypothetical protein
MPEPCSNFRIEVCGEKGVRGKRDSPQYGLCWVTLVIAVVVFQASNTLLARDVAAADRANRALRFE